jgi:hypothetical protein
MDLVTFSKPGVTNTMGMKKPELQMNGSGSGRKKYADI